MLYGGMADSQEDSGSEYEPSSEEEETPRNPAQKRKREEPKDSEEGESDGSEAAEEEEGEGEAEEDGEVEEDGSGQDGTEDGTEDSDEEGERPQKRRRIASDEGESDSASEQSQGQSESQSDGDSSGDYVPSQSSQGQSSQSQSGASQADSAAEELVRRFIGETAEWAKANGERIDAAYDSAGGWEVWLEVELYLWLLRNVPDMNVVRQNPYVQEPGQPKRRGDLLLGGTVTIELKAETAPEAPEKFAGRVDKDRGKIDAGQGERSAAVVAFARSAASKRALTDLFGPGGTQAGPLSIFWELTSG